MVFGFMNIVKNYTHLVINRLKKRVRSYIGRALGKKYSESWVNSVSEAYNHKKKYNEFLLNFRLRNFRSASEIARSLDFDLLSLKEKLIICAGLPGLL